MKKIILSIIAISFISSFSFADEGSKTTSSTTTSTTVKKKSDVSLTPEQKRILEEGEMPTSSYVVGGVLATGLGFGIGHAVQGRYGELGWVFTTTEVAGLGLAIIGASGCNNSTTYDSFGNKNQNYECTNAAPAITLGVGVLTLVGFHIWEIIDAWVTPPQRNREYRRLRERTEDAGLSMSVVPVANNKLGLGFQYQF